MEPGIEHTDAATSGGPAARRSSSDLGAQVGSIARAVSCSVRPDSALDTVEALLMDQDASAVPVLDEAGHLKGFVCANDVVRTRVDRRDDPPIARSRWDDAGLDDQPAPPTVADVRWRPGHSVPIDASLDEATALMLGNDVDHLAVVDAEGAVVGVVTALDALRGVHDAGASERDRTLEGASAEHGPADAHPSPVARLRARLAVARAFGEEPTLIAAAVRALSAICECEHFQLGALWVVDDTHDVLRCVAVFQDPKLAGDASGDAPYAGCLMQMVALRRGEGLAGLAWARGATAWRDGPTPEAHESLFARRREARITSRCCVPLRSGSVLAGVVELHGVGGSHADPLATSAMEELGAELGPLVAAKYREGLRREIEHSVAHELPGIPSVAFFDPAGRLTFASGPSLAPSLAGRRQSRRAEELFETQDHPIARGVRRAAAGEASSEVAVVPGVGVRGLAFAPVRERSGGLAGVVATAIDGVRPAPSKALAGSTDAGPLRELSAGAAHELNDAVTALRLSCGIDGRTDRSGLLPIAPGLEAAVERIERVASALGAVAREEENAAVLDVRSVLDTVVALCAHRFDDGLRLVRHYDDVPFVRARTGALHRALLDALFAILGGAGDAKASPGELRIATTTDDRGQVLTMLEHLRDGAANAQPPEPASRSCARAALGATVDASRDLIRGLGGDLVAYVGGDRAAIQIGLPANETGAAIAPRRIAGSERGRTRVLVIDDDVAVAAAIARELSACDVTIANGGRRALQILFRPHEYDVVLCDLMMPEVTGMDVFELVRVHDPECARRFVFMTGAAFTNRASAFLDEVPNPRLLKPFSGEALREIVDRHQRTLRRVEPAVAVAPAS